ncbi:ADP-ribosylglycohydrolase family protein [Conchiformibius kuhniae]|uniref:ADP-ribosylglycohydrolase family protein n=1 Tax=Conchiformibius kuhniae TaxID=211502 RepID=A0A8T9MZ16_9NEIS|nr:ADP-ribosylglycohydrolase family protein [Conchiformibius kuhniae]UOP05728.1 ADP-ribosylglycohydrolase family protein [Conchiformibius kuhniae]
MLGAAIGDVVGSRFEFANYRATDFALFTDKSGFTDDTVCTVAVAEWALGGCRGDLAVMLQRWCQRYPQVSGSYGARFGAWLWSASPEPYQSWGNGAAMRVSAVGWLFDSLTDTLNAAHDSAAVTHNHPEGIKGAQAVAAAIFWARSGESKSFIRQNITDFFDYDLSQSCGQIRPHYQFDESCQGTVPQALTAFLESEGFEDAVRLAVSLGGDSDTVAAIAGSVAEAYYRALPKQMVLETLRRLPDEMIDILARVPA